MKPATKIETVKLVTFRLGRDLFAVDIAAAERVLRYTPPNSVPDVPEWIEGVLEHRGKVLPVVDMRRRMGLTDTAITPETRILVLNTADGWVGAIVDAVQEVANVPISDVTPPPPLFRGLAAHFIRRIAKIGETLVVVLEVDRVLTSADRIVFERAVESAASGTSGATVTRD